LLFLFLAAGCSSAGVDPQVESFPDRDPPCDDRVDATILRVAKPDLSDPRFLGKFAVVEGYVLPDGTVAELHPIGGNDAKLIKLVMTAARDWRFTPGTCHGKPARQYIRFSVDGRPKKAA
jgi:hypothetical protein